MKQTEVVSISIREISFDFTKQTKAISIFIRETSFVFKKQSKQKQFRFLCLERVSN